MEQLSETMVRTLYVTVLGPSVNWRTTRHGVPARAPRTGTQGTTTAAANDGTEAERNGDGGGSAWGAQTVRTV